MAIHEIYVGGPPSANYSRSMYPSPPFVPGAAAFQAVTPSAHKGPTSYQLGRVLDTQNDTALQEFLRNATLAQGDVLGVILVPRDCIFKGMFFEVESPAGAALVLTPSIRGVAAMTFPTINGNAVARGFAKAGGAAWVETSAVVEGDDFYIHQPTLVELTLTTLTAPTHLGALRLTLVPIVETLKTGQY